MDFNYNNLPNDEDAVEMPPSKAGKIAKKVTKYFLYGISFVIYAMLFWAIFNSCEPDIFKEKLFSDATKNLDSVTFYKIQPNEFMSYSNHVHLSENYYAAESHEFELGIKIKLSETKYGDPTRLEFVLRDSLDNEYPITNMQSEQRSKYLFSRVCFGSVDLKLDNNYYYYIQENYEELKEAGEENYPSLNEHPIGTSYRLFIYEKNDDGTRTLLKDLVDYEYLGGKKDLDESGLCVYNNVTVVITE